MVITGVTVKKAEVPLAKPFIISLGTISSGEVVYIKLDTDCGITGYGEGAGVGFVTGETSETILGAIKLFEPILLGENPYAIEHIHRAMDARLAGNGAAKAAVDIALYDLMAKAAELPLYRFLGGVSNQIEADITVGIDTPEAMAAEAARCVSNGFREIKIKAGAGPEHDILAIRLSIAAATAFTAARPNVIYADLDSFHGFDDSAIIKRAFTFETPILTLSDAPGIGVEVEF